MNPRSRFSVFAGVALAAVHAGQFFITMHAQPCAWSLRQIPLASSALSAGMRI
jgi:hypothetical protein